jgi:hypothetical protein
MLPLAKMILRRDVGLFIIVLGILIGGSWAAVKITTVYLLNSERCRLKVRRCDHYGHTGKIQAAINVAKRCIIYTVLYTT